MIRFSDDDLGYLAWIAVAPRVRLVNCATFAWLNPGAGF
jgi:hypothetical protein